MNKKRKRFCNTHGTLPFFHCDVFNPSKEKEPIAKHIIAITVDNSTYDYASFKICVA